MMKMQCDNCHRELPDSCLICVKCHAPAAQTIEGYEHTAEIQRLLRKMLVQYGIGIIGTPPVFEGLLLDFLCDFETESRLLISAFRCGILDQMLAEEPDSIEPSLHNEKQKLMQQLGFSENAAQFTLACYTYMLGWAYKASLRVLPKTETNSPEKTETAQKPACIEDKLFKHIQAIRSRLCRHVKVPEGYTRLDGFCFDGFGFLRTAELPDSLIAIGEYAFSNCKNLTEVHLPKGLRIIGKGAFSQCVKLKAVTIPNGVIELSNSVFSLCSSLEYAEIPQTVSNIGNEAFSGCEKLKAVLIPASVKYIGDDAFSYCSDLTVYCYENSYAHKYCIQYKVACKTFQLGEELQYTPTKKGVTE